jgi:hypothetical protein
MHAEYGPFCRHPSIHTYWGTLLRVLVSPEAWYLVCPHRILTLAASTLNRG